MNTPPTMVSCPPRRIALGSKLTMLDESCLEDYSVNYVVIASASVKALCSD